MKPKINMHHGLKALSTTLGAGFLAFVFVNVANAQSNTLTGKNAGAKITTGTNNTADGISALGLDTTGKSNTAIGAYALKNNVAGNFNTALGNLALRNATGSSNVGLGYQALYKTTLGGFNVAIGDGALLNNTTGTGNIAIGEDAGFNLIDGNNNICIGNKGVVGKNGKILIGTGGTHTDTYVAGVIHGNGSGLTGVTIPANKLTGKIVTAQINNAAVTSVNLAPGLTLGGVTTGSFSGSLAGNAATATHATSANNATHATSADSATSATNASNIVETDRKLTVRSTGTFGEGVGFQFNSGLDGLLLETSVNGYGSDSAGLFLNGNTAVIYSPGNNSQGNTADVLRVYDEDRFSDATPVPAFKVLNMNAGISTPGKGTFGTGVDVTGDVKLGSTAQYYAPGGTEKLRLLRGCLLGAGSVWDGGGFTSARLGVGHYKVTFNTAFSSQPTVTAAVWYAPCVVTILNETATYFELKIWNMSSVPVDNNFNFTVIGPQ